MKRLPARRLTISALVLALALLVSFGAYNVLTPTKAKAAASFTPHPIFINPKYQDAGQPNASGLFLCQTPAYAVHCYGPKQFQTAYAVKPLLDAGLQGQGSTIVIIDAYQSPTARQDLDTFSQTFNLPKANLTIIAPDGVPAWDPNDANMAGWGEEISLDLQWSHALAPKAKIVLVEGKSNQDIDLLHVTQYAIDNNLGDVISQSFGEAESCVDPTILKAEHLAFEQANKKRITLFASAGDQGSAQPTCDGSSYILSASSPANDPLVTGVGGTQLTADLTTGKYIGETVWNEVATFDAAGGGGYSKIYGRPGYQNGVNTNAGRGVPDVSFDAAINDGVLVAVSYLPSGRQGGPWHIFGGTSASSPEWAGLTALGDQLAGHRLGLINEAIYKIGKSKFYNLAFHDITVGDNSFVGVDATGNTISIPGYSSGTGWDAASGWGTPRASAFLPLLVAYCDEG